MKATLVYGKAFQDQIPECVQDNERCHKANLVGLANGKAFVRAGIQKNQVKYPRLLCSSLRLLPSLNGSHKWPPKFRSLAIL